MRKLVVSILMSLDGYAEGMVDEVHVMVGNDLLGDSIRAFTVPLDDRLRLLETRRLDSSDNVLLVYATDQPDGR